MYLRNKGKFWKSNFPMYIILSYAKFNFHYDTYIQYFDILIIHT